jgi:cyclophilin family peptidyl-prolyl cis-trans isomerase
MGDVCGLQLLLHVQAPKASENFLALCASNYYDGVIFHRNIKGFMIQGGEQRLMYATLSAVEQWHTRKIS